MPGGLAAPTLLPKRRFPSVARGTGAERLGLPLPCERPDSEPALCPNAPMGGAKAQRAGQWPLVGPAKATLRLTAFEIGINPVQVEAMLRGIGFARFMNFAKNLVFPGLLIRQALPECRRSFSCSHDLPESSLLLAESERLRCGEVPSQKEVTSFSSRCRNMDCVWASLRGDCPRPHLALGLHCLRHYQAILPTFRLPPSSGDHLA